MSQLGLHRDEPDVVVVSDDSFRRLVAIELGLRPTATDAEVFAELKRLRASVLGDPDVDPEAAAEVVITEAP